VETIQEAVAKWANIPSDLIRGDSRKKQIVIARHTAIYLCSELTNLTLKSIGSHFGNRDHSTVLHSIDEAKVRIENDPKFREDIEKLKRNIELLAV
jgi:chromosomal replication initiator protein